MFVQLQEKKIRNKKRGSFKSVIWNAATNQ